MSIILHTNNLSKKERKNNKDYSFLKKYLRNYIIFNKESASKIFRTYLESSCIMYKMRESYVVLGKKKKPKKKEKSQVVPQLYVTALRFAFAITGIEINDS